MNILWIALQENAAEAAEGGPNVFNFAAGVSFWTVVIFLGLMAVLVKFAFPPILGYAAAREKRIQASLDDAKRQRAEAESLLEQQRKELATARQEAQQLIAEAKQLGERARQEVLVRARAEQEEIITRAKDEIVRERDKALESVRREAVDLAIAAASKLLEKRLDAEEDRRLVTEYLSRAAVRGPAGVA
jgi:F-type H+-transporting ATPase subunit b